MQTLSLSNELVETLAPVDQLLNTVHQRLSNLGQFTLQSRDYVDLLAIVLLLKSWVRLRSRQGHPDRLDESHVRLSSSEDRRGPSPRDCSDPSRDRPVSVVLCTRYVVSRGTPGLVTRGWPRSQESPVSTSGRRSEVHGSARAPCTWGTEAFPNSILRELSRVSGLRLLIVTREILCERGILKGFHSCEILRKGCTLKEFHSRGIFRQGRTHEEFHSREIFYKGGTLKGFHSREMFHKGRTLDEFHSCEILREGCTVKQFHSRGTGERNS